MRAAWIALTVMMACGAPGTSDPTVPSKSEASQPPQQQSENKKTNAGTLDASTIQQPSWAVVTASPSIYLETPKPQGGADKHLSGFWVVLGIIFNGGLLVVAVLQWLTYKRQATLMGYQTKINERQTRAYVFLADFVVELTTANNADYEGNESFTALLPKGTDKGLYVTRFAVLPNWKNEGFTPVKNMTVNVNWRKPGGSLAENFSYNYADEPQSFFLAPKASAISEAIEIPAIHANEIINNGMPRFGETPIMFIWGRADYFDVFDAPHFVEWCFRIRFDRHDGRTLMVRFIHHGKHNRSDEETRSQT
jgi:hypothetical protein